MASVLRHLLHLVIIVTTLLPLLLSPSTAASALKLPAACINNPQITNTDAELIQKAFSSTSGFNLSSLCSHSLPTTSSLSTPPTPPAYSLSPTGAVIINLSSHNLTGVVSWNYILNLTNLFTLDLSNNTLKGSIPSHFWSIPTLHKVNLSHNYFGGSIDFTSSNSTISSSSIQILSLSNNRFTNTVKLSGFTNLKYLDLSRNNLRSLPSGISSLTRLENLDLSKCNISGNLKSISGLKSLTHLDVSRNRLWGEFPSDFPPLSGVRYLNISRNNFSGHITRDGISRFGQSAFLRSGIEVTSNRNTNTSVSPATAVTGGVHNGNTQQEEEKQRQHQKRSNHHNRQHVSRKKNRNEHGNLRGNYHHHHHDHKKSRWERSKAFIIGISIGSSFLFIILLITTTICCIHRQRMNRHRTKWSISKPMSGGVLGSGIITSTSSSSTYKLTSCEKSGPFSFSTGSGTSWVADIKEPGSVPVVMFEKPLMRLSFKDLIVATSGFGKESQFAEGVAVYRGVLQPGELHVAIKVLESCRDMEEDEAVGIFEDIAKVRHPNLLPIAGYCIAGKEKLILYEFMANGDLHGWLEEVLPAGEPPSNIDDWSTDRWDYHINEESSSSSHSKLNWATRHRIALGVARGLAFLHHALARPIVHGHLVPSNILLSDDLEPRIADFGLRHHRRDSTSTMTTEDDVYSFGLVLMELLTGKSVTGSTGEETVKKVRKVVRDGKGIKAIDQRLVRSVGDDELLCGVVECLRVSYLCTAEMADKRPTMQQVVGMLKDVYPTTTTQMQQGAGAGACL